MPFAVLQTDLAVPSREQLTRAFEALPELTDHDAVHRAQDAVGLLAQHLTHDQAHTLLGALAAQNVSAAIVDQGELSDLPGGYATRRVDSSAQGVTLYDSLNRPMLWAWDHVKLLAAGWVNLDEFVAAERRGAPMYGQHRPVYVTEHYGEEQLHVQRVLEIHVDGEPYRYRVDGDDFQSANADTHGVADEDQRFATLVRDLVHGASQAVINRGAEALTQHAQHRLYRSQQVFEQELIWLRWLVSV